MQSLGIYVVTYFRPSPKCVSDSDTATKTKIHQSLMLLHKTLDSTFNQWNNPKTSKQEIQKVTTFHTQLYDQVQLTFRAHCGKSRL